MDEARTIDDVLVRLDDIIAEAKRDGSRLGYFPALYRKVTRSVQARIASDFFEDGARMEHLDVVFANFYLEAYDQHTRGERPSEVWRFAFEVTGQSWPIVLQHLLLGMNAHINLDLGVAAFRSVGPSGLPALHDDFNRINEVLASLVGDVQDELADIWPALGVLGRFLGSVDDDIVNFSMDRARDCAWDFAQRLASLDVQAQEAEIRRQDANMLDLARRVRYPGLLLSTATKIVRLGERGSVREIIEVLE